MNEVNTTNKDLKEVNWMGEEKDPLFNLDSAESKMDRELLSKLSNIHTGIKAYIFMGSPVTSQEHANLAVFTDCLAEKDSLALFINDIEPNEDVAYCTRKSLEEFQTMIDQDVSDGSTTYFGNANQDCLNTTIFCIIETDKDKRIKYLEEIKRYAKDMQFKVIFLTYLDSLFLEKLKEHDIKLSNALYAPYISNTEFDTIGIEGDWELSTVPSINQTNLKNVYGEIMDLFEMEFNRDHVGFAVGIHMILLKSSFDYLTWCFQQHIIKYGTMVNLNETQINEIMESFGLTVFDSNDNQIQLPDAYEDSKIISEIVLPKHSVISAAVVSESNRIDDMCAGAAKVIISNKISKIGIFGIPEGKNIYAKFVNTLTGILNNHVQETSLSQEPFKYTMYIIDHCNETINTPEESIQTNFGFELAIVCDNKFFMIEDDSKVVNFSTYLEDAKKKYVTLDVNSGIVYNPVRKVQPAQPLQTQGEDDANNGK